MHKAPHSFGRRQLVEAGLALGALAVTGPLCGCSLQDKFMAFLTDDTPSNVEEFMGIKNPNASKGADDDDEQGYADFVKLAIELNTDASTWTWDKYNNIYSYDNGCLVVGIPITAVNNDDQNRVLSSLYCSIMAPTGEVQADISKAFEGDILQQGGIPAGSTSTALIHIIYRGPGTYIIEFNNLLGRKTQLPIDILRTPEGMHPLPDALGTIETSMAVWPDIEFQAGNLALTFHGDTNSYWWTQTWDSTSDYWNGRWCVGVPVTIRNTTQSPQELDINSYMLYSPYGYLMGDPAPWLASVSAAYSGIIPPGGSIVSYIFWVLIDNGWYYAAFDNNGEKVITTVYIGQ